jgi:toxin ParE1/3/4
MARIIVSPSADADIYVIQKDLIAAAGKPIAEKFTARVESLFDRLAEYPNSGASRRKVG